MLFLGAGASSAFGIPTMQELTKKSEDVLKEKGFNQELATAYNALTKFQIIPDFESILTVFESLRSPVEAIRASGPFAAYLATLAERDIKQRVDADEILTAMKNLLVDACSHPDMAKANETYQDLFSLLGKAGNVAVGGPQPQRVGLTGGSRFQPSSNVLMQTQDIFTINYDLVIERFFDENQIGRLLFTGFVPRGPRFYWDFVEGYRWDGGGTNLVKLHGSIDQFVVEDGIEKRQALPNVGFYTKKTFGEMLVYPVHEKYVTKTPYFELFSALRQRLSREPLCIVIGYSLRDEAVNNAFADAVKTNRTLKFVYVAPHASTNINRLPVIKPRTACLDKAFGIDPFYDELLERVTVWTPK